MMVIPINSGEGRPNQKLPQQEIPPKFPRATSFTSLADLEKILAEHFQRNTQKNPDNKN